MYEAVTYEVILQRMIDRVLLQNPNIDTREGSIIYDALAPAAAELAQAYIALDASRNETFVKTSTGTYLDTRVNEFGLTRIAATKAVKKGVFNMDVPIGSRFSGDDFNYVVTEQISDGVYKIECETAGTIGNSYMGTLIPIEYIEGLTSAELTELLIPARDVETDDELIERFFKQLSEAPVDGNVTQYKKWAADYGPIGKAKVIPRWNGVNTVKVSILNNDSGAASADLIAVFQEYLDPNSEGLGNGAAPIGSIVTVTTATELPINVSANVYIADGFTEVIGIQDELTAWFKDIAYEKTNVNFYEVAAVLLANASIERIQNLTINDGTIDIQIGNEEIPVLGTFNLVMAV